MTNMTADTSRKDSAEDHYDLGVRLYEEGRLEDAIACFQIALKLLPNHEAALYGLAQVSEKLGNWEESIRCYRKIQEFNPNSAWIYVAIGDIYLKQQQAEFAIQSVNQAKNNCNPVSSEVYRLLGDALVQKEDVEQAIEAYQEGLALEPNSGRLLFKLGELYRKWTNNLDEAMHCYQKAVDVDQADAWTYYCLGNCTEKKGDVEKAIQHYQTALTLKPEAGWIHFSLGQALFKTGSFTAALECCTKAETYLDKVSPQLLRLKGKTLYELDRLDEAAESFQSAIAVKPDLGWAYAWLGKVYRDRELPEVAMDNFRKAIQMNFRSPWILHSLGQLLHQAGDSEQAMKYLREAISKKSNFPAAQQLLEVVKAEFSRPTPAFAAISETEVKQARTQKRSGEGLLSKVLSFLRRD